MKQIVVACLVLFSVLSVPFSQAGEKGAHPVMDGLVKAGTAVLKSEGAKIMEKRREKAAEKKAEKEAREAEADAAQVERKRTWGDRGRDMLDVVLHKDGSAPEVVKATLDVVLDEYREQFKEEGRRYAKEIGDTLAERATANQKIASTLSSVRVLCWCVVVYLTLVTIYLVFTVRRLRRANARLQELVESSLRKKS